MKPKLDLENYNWEEIQKLYDEGLSLSELNVSRRAYQRALEEGLLIKRKKMISEDTKKKISEKRKKWLSENPDDHPWRKKSKFISTPCEKLKEFLRRNKIEFEEEMIVSKERNFSVDVLIPSKNLIVEVNGNQHYDREGNLQPYYQERHDHIVELGWNVIEMHYSLVWNENLCLELIKNQPETSLILEYRKKEKLQDKRKYGSRSNYLNFKREEYIQKSKISVDLILASDIDFSKNGWVGKVADLIDQKPQKIKGWMKKVMPDFYEKNCNKRKTPIRITCRN